MSRFSGIPVDEPKKPRFGGVPAEPSEASPAKPQGFSFLEMAKNIPESASNIVGGTIEAAMQPKRTAEGISELASGLTSKAGRGVSEFMSDVTGTDYRMPAQESEATADAVGQFIMDRYGSLDAFKQTAMNDPVGLLLDASMGLMLTGKLAKAGAAIDPISALSKGSRLAAGKMGRSMVEGAAKFPARGKVPPGRLVETVLREKIPLTAKGVLKRKDLVSSINNQIDGLIAVADKTGKPVPVSALFKHFKQLRQEVGGPRLEGAKDLRLVDNVARAYKQHVDKIGKSKLTASDLQDFKKDAWKKINWARKQQKTKPPRESAYRAAGTAARENIERLVPETAALNTREARLLELGDALEMASGRIARRDISGIGAPIKIGAGSAVGGDIGAGVGTLAAILDMPKPKAWMGQKLYNLSQSQLAQILAEGVPSTLARQAVMQSGRDQ